MTQKKKPTLSFEVPEEVNSAAGSGWVYRSGDEEVDTLEPSAEAADVNLDASGAAAEALETAFFGMARIVTLGVLVVTIPFAMGLRMIGSLTGTER